MTRLLVRECSTCQHEHICMEFASAFVCRACALGASCDRDVADRKLAGATTAS